MKICIGIAVGCIALCQWSASLPSVSAQSPLRGTVSSDDVPAAALLTDRGTDLAKQLFLLRHSESGMGENHPALPEIREQIAAVKSELEAWRPAPNPFRRAETQAVADQMDDPVPAMNETDLREIVLILTREIAELKRQLSEVNARLRRLERQSKQ